MGGGKNVVASLARPMHVASSEAGQEQRSRAELGKRLLIHPPKPATESSLPVVNLQLARRFFTRDFEGPEDPICEGKLPFLI
jgi:hypothetical protein